MDITYTYLLHDCIKNIKDCTHLVPCCHILPVTLIIEIKNCIEHSRECFFTYNYTLMSCEILVPALRSTKSHLHDFKKDYARPTDENSCVDIHGKFCAWPLMTWQVIRWSFITQWIIVYFVEWRMSRKYVSSVRGTEPKPWHLERKIQNIAHIQRV